MDIDNSDNELDECQASLHFFRLLGELHHSYTALEHELSCLVFAGVTRFASPVDGGMLAMLGGQRMSTLKDSIKRILKNTKADSERLSFVSNVFSQLGEIQFFRDRLAHYLTVMSDYNPECWVNMNFTGIREIEKMEDLHFNLFALHAAASDLRLMRTIVGSVFNYRIDGANADLPEIPSWLFEPSMLVRNRPVKRKRAVPEGGKIKVTNIEK